MTNVKINSANPVICIDKSQDYEDFSAIDLGVVCAAQKIIHGTAQVVGDSGEADKGYVLPFGEMRDQIDPQVQLR